ncbi:MAG: hypothetical protein KDH19_08530 [Geminicoccaceae bacterium]|nr:hypothetical protein [Geminicoccaceae bacterium]
MPQHHERFPQRADLYDVIDFLAAGFAFPVAAGALSAIGVETTAAEHAWVLDRLPVAAIVVALMLKILQDMSPHAPDSSRRLHQVFWSCCVLPLTLFWALFLRGHADALSPALLFASWLVLTPATFIPRFLAEFLLPEKESAPAE